jgi:hypothetical protein
LADPHPAGSHHPTLCQACLKSVRLELASMPKRASMWHAFECPHCLKPNFLKLKVPSKIVEAFPDPDRRTY